MKEIERPFVSAKFLLATLPGATVIPEGFAVTQCPTRTASGAHRRLSSRNGDGKPVLTPTNIMKAGYANRGLRGYAAISRANVG